MPKISIIMPIYNKVKYIDKAIMSIKNQTFIDWELIIVDDGSTDGSSEKCDLYQHDSRIRIIHTNNGGVSKARNLGLQFAKGEYITFIDSDDYVSNIFLEQLYVPNKEMIVGGLKKVDHKGEVLEKISPNLYGECNIKTIVQSFYLEQSLTGIYGFVSGKLVNRHIIEKNKILFDEKIKLAEDYEFYLKVYSVIESIYFQDGTDYYYVQETENSAICTDDSKIDFFTQIDIHVKTKKLLEQYNEFRAKEKEMFLQNVTGYLYTILIMNPCRNYKEFLKLFSKLKKVVPETSNNVQGFCKICVQFFEKDYKVPLYIILKLRELVRK